MTYYDIIVCYDRGAGGRMGWQTLKGVRIEHLLWSNGAFPISFTGFYDNKM